MKTMYIKDKLSRCEDLEGLKEEILPLLQSQQELWAEKIKEILDTTGYTKIEFAKLCGVSRVTLDKWSKGAIPRSREMFLRIGLAAGYDIEQINLLLQRYGQYSALYSKRLEDCVCIYVLGNVAKDKVLHKYLYLLDRIKAGLVNDETNEAENVSTYKFDAQLAKVQDEDELETFIKENIAMFSYTYHKFYAYVKMCITANYKEYANSISDLAVIQGWSSSLKQCVSAIRQNKWYPTRNKIISLGLHLSMDHDQIDQMLQLAHMEPLCAKNIFETVIIYILDSASLNNMLDTDSETFDPDDLCRYARDVLSELDLPEVEDFISELPSIEDIW